MMKVLRSIPRNVTLLNVLLAVALVMAGIGIICPAMSVNNRLKLPRIVPKETVLPEKPAEEVAQPLPTDYAVVTEMNLFHPQRVIPIDAKKELPKPELFLCGIIMYGNQRVAFVEDKKNPTTSPGRGKRQAELRKGSVYAGYSVTEINNDSIILTRGEQSVSVYLMDQAKRGGKNAPSAPAEAMPSSPRSPSSSPTPPAAPPSPRPSRPLPSKGPGEPPSGSNKAPPSPVPPHHRDR
ncbi:MAG: hypothetical protein A4E60_00055 [Syntrophorhabdus sp. PtaB.Bin047]|jgi:type II secretory pathway component PulC|nr:MAG: hypothetical protein A4E60_00055 [Syntrophorhabdus sp. PtaB.Bin047]